MFEIGASVQMQNGRIRYQNEIDSFFYLFSGQLFIRPRF